jgi:hypothetical protein
VETTSLGVIKHGGKAIVRSGSGASVLYTVPTDGRLHVVACWLSAAGSITVSKVEFDPNTRTVLTGTVAYVAGMDIPVPAGETVNLTGGTGGIFGWFEPAIG